MIYLIIFSAAIFFASLGVIPPGMLNISIASLSITQNKKQAIQFLYGAILIVFVQSYIGFYFAKYFESHPQITSNLKVIATVIFSLLTIYFIGKGVQDKFSSQNIDFSKTRDHKSISNFWRGILLSSLNLFPIPYYVFISLFLGTLIKIQYDFFTAIIFSFGAMLGSGIIFWGYAAYFKNKENKMSFFIHNINFIIGSITGVIAIITCIK